MELNRLAELIKMHSPAHFRDICATITSLADEMEYTKAALSADLMTAQNQGDFHKAREILDAQEELTRRITDLRRFIIENENESEGSEDIGDGGIPEIGERVDYSLYDMDDTIAYDIEDTPVTFKRPAAFSFKGKRYQVTKWKTMLVKLCDLLYIENPEIIKSMAGEERQPGLKRVKMSTNMADIHSPEKISGSNIWIETNRSASDIRKSILILLKRYSISSETVKVYFRRDYAALHAEENNEEKKDG